MYFFIFGPPPVDLQSYYILYKACACDLRYASPIAHMTQLIMHYMLSLMCHSLGGSTLCFPSSSLLWYNACAILNNAHLYERYTGKVYRADVVRNYDTIPQEEAERDSLLSSWTLRCFHPEGRAMQVNSTTLPSCTDVERHPFS